MAAAAAGSGHAQSVDELKRLSVEELANIEVTSVFKRPVALSKSPASVYVITDEDIRRSGATSIPEALRLAPNLHVARRNARDYAISARGFNGFESSNKLLVLIDGRSVYSELHSGVFWDEQHVPLANIDRIEVISGPGGTLWGANAMNGVINIITKDAYRTRGTLADIRYGNAIRSATARHSGRIGNDGAFRVYATGFERGYTDNPDGSSANDDWIGRQGGFRTDFSAGEDSFTVQGDIYAHKLNGGGDLSGGNLLARWERWLGPGSSVEVQTYYDRADRSSAGVSDTRETVDVEAQHVFAPFEGHRVVWGGGYRRVQDEFINTVNAFVLDPTADTLHFANIFAQDSIALRDDLTFTFGTKVEYSSYSGPEYLPSASLSWLVTDNHMLWSAVSRAVRTPSRIDRDLTAAGIVIPGNFESETLIAYEVGYRGMPIERSSLSVSLFYNDYDDLRTVEPAPGGGLPVTVGNGLEGHTAGVEAWGDYQVLAWWRLSAGFTFLHKSFHLEDDSADTSGGASLGNDPDYLYQLRSRMNLTEDIELDIALRKVDALPDPRVPGYLELDARLGWDVAEGVELSIAGFNLLDSRHPETDEPAARNEVRRSVYAGVRWRF